MEKEKMPNLQKQKKNKQLYKRKYGYNKISGCTCICWRRCAKTGFINNDWKNGIVCKFDYQKPPQIEKRIKAICNGYKVNISSNTIRYFIECCGTNMQDLINEIRKLIEYEGENGTISNEDIDKLAIKN